MREVTVTLRNGMTRTVRVPIPKNLGNLEECDYIDNWLADNVKDAVGWRL